MLHGAHLIQRSMWRCKKIHIIYFHSFLLSSRSHNIMKALHFADAKVHSFIFHYESAEFHWILFCRLLLVNDIHCVCACVCVYIGIWSSAGNCQYLFDILSPIAYAPHPRFHAIVYTHNFRIFLTFTEILHKCVESGGYFNQRMFSHLWILIIRQTDRKRIWERDRD